MLDLRGQDCEDREVTVKFQTGKSDRSERHNYLVDNRSNFQNADSRTNYKNKDWIIFIAFERDHKSYHRKVRKNCHHQTEATATAHSKAHRHGTACKFSDISRLLNSDAFHSYHFCPFEISL